MTDIANVGCRVLFQRLRRVWAIFALLSAPCLVFAKQYTFKIYSQPEGLRNQVINCLLQDRKGFLWAGTENGLFRYDGYRFTFFGRHDGLPDETIQSLHESPDGTLWAATRFGVAYWDGKRFSADPVLGKTEVFGYSNLVSDLKGRIYLGTASGLAVREVGPGSREARFHFLTQQAVHGVYVDSSDTVWFGSGGMLWSLRGGQPAAAGPEARLPHDRWDAMLLDRAGNFWVRSSEHLMVRRPGAPAFDKVSGIPHSPEFGLLYETRDGHVFVPTDGGLMGYSDGKWERIGTRQGLASDEATCVLQDQEGSVWIGLGGEGLERWIGFREWTSWTAADGLTSNIVWDLRRDRAGKLWAATEQGLHVQDPKTADWVLKSDRHLNVRTVAVDPGNGTLWYGAKTGGVFRLDRNTGQVRQFGAKSGLENDRVNSLFWDSAHNLWAATGGGLFRGQVSGGNVHFARQEVPFGDSFEEFFGYLIDHRGRLWVGGSRGLVVLENGKWRRFSMRDGLVQEGVSHVAETPDGAIWLGYLTNSGVSRLVYEDGRVHFDHFTTKNGLTSNGSVFVGTDARGWLWVGTDNGVDVRIGSTWKHLGKADGLIWDDCDALAFHADPDGSVWIGTSGGISRFKPLKPLHADAPPATFITSVTAGAKSLDPQGPIATNYQDRSFVISFAAPTYLNEAAVRFRYRMAGFEENWVDTDDRCARYPNLPAGAYRFEVAARKAGGDWNRNAASVPIKILPRWWQTWNFRVLAGLILVFATYRIWPLRIRYLLLKQEQLENLLLQAQTADRLKSEALVEITRGEARERNRSQVLELVGSHQPLGKILDSIVEMVEVDDPETICLILIVREGRFRYGASRSLPIAIARSFEGFPLDSASTCFSVAAHRIEAVEVDDIGTSTLWEQSRHALVELGIWRSRSAPIVSSCADVLGTITFFHRTPHRHSTGSRNFLESAARLASIGMEHLDLYEQLSYRAQYDVLTDLPNRLLFGTRLEQAIVRAQRLETMLAVLMIDLDGFKAINDTFGHQAGDLVLQTVARRIRSCIRRDDTAARLGGDEFIVLLETLERGAVDIVISKLLEAIREPITIGNQDVSVTASVGVGLYPEDSLEAADLIRYADLAMYHVKRVGSNAHEFFAPAVAPAPPSRTEIEAHLRNALAGREFELNYQPQCRLDGSLAGFEALLRWTNPTLGAVPPSRFIAVAEATGLIVPIGQWVLEEAFRQSTAWKKTGYSNFRMAVNVSAYQFANPDFPEIVKHLLDVIGVAPQTVELELTENAIFKDVATSSALLRELRRTGVSIAIDDFGTGYSSLNNLRRLPVNTIKIDQSLVQGLGVGSSDSLRMVQAIVDLAQDLNLRVVAEGVEKAEQLQCLDSLGCDCAQGYFLGKPISVHEATILLGRSRGGPVLMGSRESFDIEPSAVAL